LNVTSVLVEGGGELLGSFFDEGLVDKLSLFYAPVVIGGRDAKTPVEGLGVARVSAAKKLREVIWRKLGGGNFVVEGYLR
jgi:diaminohydroxyphosphoribosylaminopyrimidine deaminase/5-amino-6-(5-phosphoribosylamino)uracil reductase